MQETLTKKAERFIREQKLIAEGERVLAGLSGGADSVCLVAVLCELSGILSFEVGAFHLNHGIRGSEADEDEAFSRALCEGFGIPFFAVREDVPQYAKEHRTGLEEAGRELRYRAAGRLASEKGYDKIALAHQQNDVAETFLFHLFRGSSVPGLASIPAKRGNIIRPLLLCGREEIEAYLAEKGLSYRTDATNQETEYTRNKIRHCILSYAKGHINEGAVRHTAEAAAELSLLKDYLFSEAKELCAQAAETPGEFRLPVAVLEKKHRVLQEEVIHMLLVRAAGSARDITRAHVLAVRGLCFSQSGKQVSLPHGLTAGRSFAELFIKKAEPGGMDAPEKEYLVEVPGEYSVGAAGETMVFCCFPYKKNTEIPKNEYTKWFDYGKIKNSIVIRTRMPGDYLTVNSMNHHKTLKSYFIDHKIPQKERDQICLLADDRHIIWIVGERISNYYKVSEHTKMILHVVFEKDSY